eukprot:jgi/Hompol1/6973/HPOL_001686-RA
MPAGGFVPPTFASAPTHSNAPGGAQYTPQPASQPAPPPISGVPGVPGFNRSQSVPPSMMPYPGMTAPHMQPQPSSGGASVSAAAPQAPAKHPAGDRSHISPANRPCYVGLQKQLDEYKTAATAPHHAQNYRDVERRIHQLFDQLNNDEVPQDVVGQLVAISKAIDSSDFATAHRIQMDLMTKRFDVTGLWMVGLKRLIDSLERIAQYGALSPPQPAAAALPHPSNVHAPPQHGAAFGNAAPGGPVAGHSHSHPHPPPISAAFQPQPQQQQQQQTRPPPVFAPPPPPTSTPIMGHPAPPTSYGGLGRSSTVSSGSAAAMPPPPIAGPPTGYAPSMSGGFSASASASAVAPGPPPTSFNPQPHSHPHPPPPTSGMIGQPPTGMGMGPGSGSGSGIGGIAPPPIRPGNAFALSHQPPPTTAPHGYGNPAALPPPPTSGPYGQQR